MGRGYTIHHMRIHLPHIGRYLPHSMEEPAYFLGLAGIALILTTFAVYLYSLLP